MSQLIWAGAGERSPGQVRGVTVNRPGILPLSGLGRKQFHFLYSVRPGTDTDLSDRGFSCKSHLRIWSHWFFFKSLIRKSLKCDHVTMWWYGWMIFICIFSKIRLLWALPLLFAIYRFLVTLKSSLLSTNRNIKKKHQSWIYGGGSVVIMMIMRTLDIFGSDCLR